jgi:hypothetical protein
MLQSLRPPDGYDRHGKRCDGLLQKRFVIGLAANGVEDVSSPKTPLCADALKRRNDATRAVSG